MSPFTPLGVSLAAALLTAGSISPAFANVIVKETHGRFEVNEHRSPPKVTLNFKILNTNVLFSVTLGTIAVSISEIGGDTELDALNTIPSIDTKCDGTTLEGTNFPILGPSECVEPVSVFVEDNDPSDDRNKINDVGHWFVQISVPFSGDGGIPAVAGANVDVFDMPEPASLAVLGVAVAGLAGLRRRRARP